MSLIPSKGSVFFTNQTHSMLNNLSIQDLASLLSGQKTGFADSIMSFTYTPPQWAHYPFETVGLFFEQAGEEFWIHYSKKAFYGAVCINAIKDGVHFSETQFEELKTFWKRMLTKDITEKDCSKYISKAELESTVNPIFRIPEGCGRFTSRKN